MRYKTKLLVINSLSKKIIGIYITVLILVTFSPTLCIADPSTPLGQQSNTILTANTGGPYTGNVNDYILFDGSESSGNIVSYEWDFNDGTTGIGIIIYHIYSNPGTYAVTLTVTNSTGATASNTATVTITEPSIIEPSITISNLTYPSRVTSDNIVTIYAAVIGNNAISSVTLNWYDGSKNYDIEMTADGDIYSSKIGPFSEGITIEFQIEAYDVEGNWTDSRGQFEVAGSSVIEEVERVSKWENKTVVMKDTSVSRITFQPREDLHNVKIIVEDLTSEEIKKKTYTGEGQVYWYFNLRITANDIYVSEDDIESSTIEFKVEKNWAKKVRTDEQGRKYNLSDISLFRYTNNNWEKLTTTITGEEYETYILYKVEVPGYSTFAVVGSKVVEKESFPDKTEEIPWIIIIGFVIAAIVILLIVLIRARFIYTDEETQRKK